MAHLDLTQSSSKIAVEPVGLQGRRGYMLVAAGFASFTIVAVAAAMMAFLF
jgi:hypothetical protein